MPDRSKRRKKNKNKRKVKNNTPNLNSSTQNSCNDAVGDDGSLNEEDNQRMNIHDDIKENDSKKYFAAATYVDNQESDSKIDSNVDTCKITALTHIKNTHKYIVESPEQSSKTNVKPKLNSIPKSKSLDADDVPAIEDVTDELGLRSEDETSIAYSNAIISEAESDVEWEMADKLDENTTTSANSVVVGTLSIETLPFNVAECEQTQPLSPEEELSLRQYLQTLNLVTCPEQVTTIEVDVENNSSDNQSAKLRKKGVTDDKSKPIFSVPRFLDVIDEESNESSSTSRRQSYLNEKKNEFDDLEDDVFIDQNKTQEKKEKFPLPKSNTKAERKHQPVPQECLLVGAKIVEPVNNEGCGNWTVQTVEKLTGAEVVYLTDSSSSASDIYDLSEEVENIVDNDESTVRIVTPTIEVTDTNGFLSKTFAATENVNSPEATQSLEDSCIKPPPPSPQTVVATDEIKLFTQSDEMHTAIDKDAARDCKEIVVLTNENFNSSLVVLEADGTLTADKDPQQCVSSIEINKINQINKEPCEKGENCYHTEINDLKQELNKVLNNLMKEVSAESENINISSKDTISRQDSSSSISSSQCTAKYNPNSSSLNDIANLLHDDPMVTKNRDVRNNENDTTCIKKSNDIEISHVKDVFEYVTGFSNGGTSHKKNNIQPNLLKDICLHKITSLPFGEKMIEELASVSEKLQNINIIANSETGIEGIQSRITPFDLAPDSSSNKKVALPTNHHTHLQPKSSPPPVTPRHSSLKISHDEPSWSGTATKKDPSMYVCLSPSHKMLMEKTNTIIDKNDTSQLLDLNKKYVDRKGYNEYYRKEQKSEHNNSNNFESGILPFKSQTGNRLLALMRDPAINSNAKIYGRSRSYTSSDRIHNYNEDKKNELNSSGYRNSRSAVDLTKEYNFRPIPPPRPRTYSAAIYESDESSDFMDHTYKSFKNEKKIFHFSTGALNKEIENDVSSIQNMHRKYTSVRDNLKDIFESNNNKPLRRPSLPKDLCEQQMDYIRQKEKEVEAEILRLELDRSNGSRIERKGPRAPLLSEKEIMDDRQFDANTYHISRNRDVAVHSNKTSHVSSKKEFSASFKSSQEEILRDKMYSEYVCKMAERQDRKQHKIIKITPNPLVNDTKNASRSLPLLIANQNEVKATNNKIEEEFISKAKERWEKLGFKDPETEDERERSKKQEYREPKIIEHKIKVIEGGKEKDMQRLPSHLREFVQFTAGERGSAADGPGESETGKNNSFFIVICAVVIVMLAIGKRMIPFFRNNNNN